MGKNCGNITDRANAKIAEYGMQNNKEFKNIFIDLMLLNSELRGNPEYCMQSIENIRDLTFYEMNRRRRNAQYVVECNELIKTLKKSIRMNNPYYLDEIVEYNKKIYETIEIIKKIRDYFMKTGKKLIK